MAAKRKCRSKTKRGKPCKAPPLKPGTVIEDVTVSGQWCRQHDQDLPDSARIGGKQPGAGRPPLPKPMDLARELVEKNAVVLLRPHFKALGYLLNDDGTLTPNGQGAIVVHQGIATDIEDLGAQQAAAERLLDRIYGKPRQQLEHAGSETGAPVQIVAAVHDPATSPSSTETVGRAAHDFLRAARGQRSGGPVDPGDSGTSD